MKMKKTMSLFLALAMSASMPFAVLATENLDSAIQVNPDGLLDNMQVQSEGVAKIGQTSYNTLEDAIKNAAAGSEVVLLQDVSDGSSIIIDKNLVLNLNGKSYSVTNANSTSKMAKPCIQIASKVGATIKGGAVIAGQTDIADVIENNGELVLNGVVLKAASGKNALKNNSNASVSINNSATAISGNVSSDGKLTVGDGKFSNDITGAGKLTINGGTFSGNINADSIEAISGGTFDGTITTKSKGFISGGTFNNQTKPDKSFIADGKELDASGNVIEKQQTDVGNEPMTAPLTITEDNNYKTVNCTDIYLKAALEKMDVAIADSDFLAKVPGITKQQALKAYNDANGTSLTLDDIDKLSIAAKKKLVISADHISTVKGRENFSLSITPSVTVYVENKTEGKNSAPSSYNVDVLKTPVNVTIPLSDQFASVKEYTVSHDGVSTDVAVSNSSITLNNVRSVASAFVVSAKAANDDYLSFPTTATVKVNAENKIGNGPTESEMVEKIKSTSFSPSTFAFKSEGLAPIKESEARTKLGNVAGDITLSAEVTVDIQLTSRSNAQNKENFNLKFIPRYVINANAGGKSAPVANGEFTPAEQIKVTVPLHDSFAKLKAQNRAFTINGRADESTSNNSIAFTTSSLRGDFMVQASKGEDKPTPTPPPSGYDKQITVLDGTYKIKDKKLIKTDSNNTIKFDESAYLVVVKGGYHPSTNANAVAPEYFLSKDDVSKIRMGSVKFEENGKLVDGKISWQARMIKVDGKNKGVYLIEIPIKKNSGYTSSKDIFGNFELRASKPYYFGNDETKENVNFYVEVDVDVNTGTDEIYDGTHVYEFNDTEDDEITLYGGDGTFIVDTRGQGKLLIKTDVKYNEGIEKVNPNANYVYYNSNYPTFNRLGYLYLKANKGDKIYKVDRDTGKLTKMPVPYDRDMEAFKIRTRTLGCYVVAEKELDLDKINGVIAPEPVKPPVAPPSIINPPTGAAI